MRKLIEGIVDFRNRILPNCRDTFAELAKGQNPDVLFITCSDSRVAPNWFASTNPGELFVIRNVGNLVPPASSVPSVNESDVSALAAVEFSVLKLNVAHIVVCGHSECGAMKALAFPTDLETTPHLKSWLHYGEPSLDKINRGISLDKKLSRENQLSQINVLQQIEHLKSYPFIQEQLDQSKIEIHGWWFDIAKADVHSFNKKTNRFELIE
ncbi:MAG: carbonic anhydrase [Deltaproteobacteria bacterium]|nr:carbonic anhydrase [Deltaproteobacteria bacterium]